MITANNLTIYLGGELILNDATFQAPDGERIAIVGPNGAGKSTLMKAIKGLVSVESGEVLLPKGSTIGYLPQSANLVSHRTIREEMRSIFEDALSAFGEMEDLEHRMGEVDHETDAFRHIATRYDFLLSEINRLDAYAMDANIGQVSAGLGFATSDLDRSCGEFSGGWQMRVELAKVLLARPDILLLDEPTNHLDLETIQWLEEWILNLKANVLFVSHERSFMDRLADRIFEIDRTQLTIYKGNYSDYLDLREERRLIQQRAFENQQREIERAESFITRFRAQANKAAGVQSRVKMLEKLERLTPPTSDAATIHFQFPQPPRSVKEVIQIKDVRQSYGDLTVFEDVNLTIYRGERVALVGVNGAGKSTLMKLIAGEEKPTAGLCEIGLNVEKQYFAQYEDDALRSGYTVKQSLESVAPLGEAQKARNVAGAFLFKDDDVDKPVTVLSGGEKTRLRLAMMLFSPANLLLLDEPTNHLDIGSRQTLEKALSEYTGTVVMVSHDRTFVDRVANRIIEIANGEAREYWGSYREYLKKHRQEIGLQARDFPAGHPKASQEETLPGGAPTSEEQKLLDDMKAVEPRQASKAQRMAQRRNDAETRKEARRRIKPLRDRVRALERDIEQLEKREEEIERILADPVTYANPDRIADLGREKKETAEKLAETMTRWEQAGEELETTMAESS